MDTGRVDPRVGSGRVGSRVRVKADLAGRVGSGRVKISEMHYFFSLSVDLSKLLLPTLSFVKKVSKYVAKQNVDFYSASTS